MKKLLLLLLLCANTVVAQSDSTRLGVRGFLVKMARYESNHNPRAVNRFGMMGKYQFHPSTLRSLGIRVSQYRFLHDEALQDSAMLLYMKANAQELRPIIQRYSGTTHRGVFVTKSGILAAAHLSGTMGVHSFFKPKKYNYRLSDANGTSVQFYMKQFSQFNIDTL
jgi:hypothetical protein